MQNQIVTLIGSTAVTTSLAIAEGTKTQHKNILELVRTYQADLEEFGSLAFETRVTRSDGRGGEPTQYAQLNEQQATLLMSYMKNTEIVRSFKKGLVRAFFEIAKQLKNRPVANLNDPDTLRALLMDYSAEVKALNATVTNKEQVIAAQAPKVEAFNRLEAATDGAMCITNAAKCLQIRPKVLFDYLKAKNWIYRRAGSTTLLGYEAKTKQGLLEHKLTSVTTDDVEKVRTQVLVTAKGLAALAKLMSPFNVDEFPLLATA